MKRKFILSEDSIPKRWYNIVPDLPEKLPPMINPETKEHTGLPPFLFPLECIKQEASTKRWIGIPDELRDIYRIWRPTPLFRACRLEEALNTPAKIYYKYEGVSPPGSHKPNTAVAQAYYAKKEGVKRLATETGAGQWGSAVAFAAMLFGLEATIYMVKASYYQKPYRRVMMENWGANVIPSPSDTTDVGRNLQKIDPDNTGSLGIAISEAIFDAVNHAGTKYVLGSVLNHVLLHQTIVGLESIKQMKMTGDYPDMVVGCIGGGSNYFGALAPWYQLMHAKKSEKDIKFIAAESESCPRVTRGTYMYDHGDTGRMTPLLKMYTLGHGFIPAPVHAGGLRYHGMAPLISLLNRHGIIETRAFDQVTTLSAGVQFSRTEGIIPAPETAHAIKAAIDEAIKCKKTGEEKTILIAFSGHGHFDMSAYEDLHAGSLYPYKLDDTKIKSSIAEIHDLYPWLNK